MSKTDSGPTSESSENTEKPRHLAMRAGAFVLLQVLLFLGQYNSCTTGESVDCLPLFL